MWELIQNNKRKSVLLFFAMGVCLIALGAVIGEVLNSGGAGNGIMIASILWIILSVVSYFSGDNILLSVSNAEEVTASVHPQLFNIVDEMRIASNLKVMPKIYIIDEKAPNAFATGRNSEKSAIAVTTGLLTKLNRDELQGVIAHEMSHVLNRDVLFMTFAGVLLGSIILISNAFLRSGRSGGDSSRRYRSSKGSAASIPIFILALLFAILAPLLARILYFAMSRNREYLADASGVRLTRYPEGLASALEKISKNDLELTSANEVTAPMYIDNPFRTQTSGFMGLLDTHPPIDKRIQILRKMMYGVSYTNYQQAFSQVEGSKELIPASELKKDENLTIRAASPEAISLKSKKEEVRSAGDLTRAVNQFAFLTCTCGLKIKVPPEYQKLVILCPRCFHSLENPFAGKNSGADLAQKAILDDQNQAEYARKTKGWESFTCICGKLLQISPEFSGHNVVCSRCGRKTEIKNNKIESAA